MATQTQTIFARADKNSASDPTRPVAAPRLRGYKDFLTPALHRRFTTAAAVVLVFCWLDSWLLSNSDSFFWALFPLGPTGIRALLLSIPCLAVFIVRVANMHIGKRTTASPAESAYSQLLSGKTLHTLIWYVFSSWLFGEIYIWSKSDKAELMMVDPGQPYERPQLNENPIFLRCCFLQLGVLRAIWHLARDCDIVAIPAGKEEEPPHKNLVIETMGVSAATLQKLPRPFRYLLERIGIILNTCALTSLLNWGVSFLSYFLIYRYPAWRWTYSTVRPFFGQMQSTSKPRGFTHAPKVAWQALSAAFMLCFLWEISNTIFDALVTEPPIKKGEPLTSEIKDGRGVILHKSQDPNGSLINGLKSKKEVNKAFAFWELFLICTKYEKRRKTIYTEVDRKDGTTWSQVCEQSLKEISDMKDRVKTAGEPAEYKAKQDLLDEQKKHHTDLIPYEKENLGLKKIADQGVYNDGDLFAKRKPDLIQGFGEFAKSVGQSPGADPLSPVAKKAIAWTEQHMTPEQRQMFSREGIEREASGRLSGLLATPLGEPFRSTFARRVEAVVLGTPTSNKTNIIHAAKALSKLAVSSLKEDEYGLVQRDIPKIIRTFTETIQTVEKFVKELKPHWTDVEGKRGLGEAQEVLDVLKTTLEEIVLAFGEYASSLGLSKKEVREAREAAAKVPVREAIAAQPRQQQPAVGQPERPQMEEANPRQRRVYN